MTLRIDISPDTERMLRAKAAAVGEDVAHYAARILERSAGTALRMEAISGPVGEAFRASGMTEEELSVELERAKQEARARRRAS
jgi:hypothetical protein